MTDRAHVEPVHASDHCRGATTPAVTMIEYGDYDCPHTRAAQKIVDRIVAENDDVQVVFRHFPLRHMHANAELLSRMAEAASRQGRFWPMHDHLMGHVGRVDDRAIMSDVRKVGLALPAVERDLDDSAVLARIEHDVEHGRARGVHSTPTFFFNGVMHDGHYDYETLLGRLDEARRLGTKQR